MGRLESIGSAWSRLLLFFFLIRENASAGCGANKLMPARKPAPIRVCVLVFTPIFNSYYFILCDMK